MYWIDNNSLFSLNGVKKINMNSPVSHISFYEAMAFARYKNTRLPSEFELEYVLKTSKKSGNFLENKFLKSIHIIPKNFLIIFSVIFGFGHQVLIYHIKIMILIKIHCQNIMVNLCVIN